MSPNSAAGTAGESGRERRAPPPTAFVLRAPALRSEECRQPEEHQHGCECAVSHLSPPLSFDSVVRIIEAAAGPGNEPRLMPFDASAAAVEDPTQPWMSTGKGSPSACAGSARSGGSANVRSPSLA